MPNNEFKCSRYFSEYKSLRYIKYNIKLVRFVNLAKKLGVGCWSKLRKGVKLSIPISSAGMGTLTPFCYFFRLRFNRSSERCV